MWTYRQTGKGEPAAKVQENVPALLYSFFFLAMYICRPHIYIIVSCFEVMDQYLHKSMNRMCGEEIFCGTVTNSKHQHVLYADLIHLLFALFICSCRNRAEPLQYVWAISYHLVALALAQFQQGNYIYFFLSQCSAPICTVVV